MNRIDAYKAGREARKELIKARFEALNPVAKKAKPKSKSTLTKTE